MRMQITHFSLFMSVIWSSALAVFNYLCRKKYFFIRQFGITSLLFLYLLSAIRLMIPYEFSFTIVIPLKGIFSSVYKIISLNKIGESQISILLILIVMWVLVSVVLIVRFVYQYIKTMKKFSACILREDEQCKRIFNKVLNESKRRIKIKIRTCKSIVIPMGVGILKKSILLPDEDYSDMELYYILRHEYTHFQNKDLFIKISIHIFCCIFWWNPIIHLLKKDLAQTLEIKCDLDVTDGMENSAKAEYLTTIVTILKKVDEKRIVESCYGTTALVSKKLETEIVERFKIVSGSYGHKRKSLLFTGSWFLVFIMLMFASYSFVVQPDYEAPVNEIESEPGMSEVTGNNSYIIKNAGGTYTLILPDGRKQDIEEGMAMNMISQGFNLLEEDIE